MNDVVTLLEILPKKLKDLVEKAGNLDKIAEIVLDYQRPLEIRYLDGIAEYENVLITREDLIYIQGKVTTFGNDNRAGIDNTLHRISQILNRSGKIIGLTLRVGKTVDNAHITLIGLLAEGKSILLVGAPGSGKTTILRAAASFLSIEEGQKVIVVDTSDEIAGAGDVPHKAIGKARKMPVPFNKSQSEILIEAVENHWPEVIIIDEISDEKEVASIRSIAKRGVKVLATVHGKEFTDLLSNPPILGLLGGIKSVTISDERARENNSSKSILERQGEPCFDVVVEIVDHETIRVYHNLKETIDCTLRGGTVTPEEIRVINLNGKKTVKSVKKYELREPNIPNVRRQSFQRKN